jgi:transporter family protein
LAISIRNISISIILFIVLLVSGQLDGLLRIDRRSSLFIIAEGVCAGLLGHFAYNYALKAGEVSHIALLGRAAPIVTVLLSVFLLGESVSLGKIGGMILIITGAIWMSL